MIQLQEYFTVKYKPTILTQERQVPYVSRTSLRNGISGLTNTTSIIPKNTISVACSGSVLESFYHHYEYASGKDVYYLEPKVTLTLNQKLYYCMIIKANKYKYSFGRQANRTLKNLLIPKLNEIPDYVNKITIQNLESNKPKIPNMLNKQTTTKQTSQKQQELISTNWKYFKVSDLFSITKGTESIRTEQEGAISETTIPLISATVNNNGIITKINTLKKTYQNCLTITSSAVPGTTFYQENQFAATESINICIPKFNMNKYTALFLVTVFNMEKFKFNYARKYSKTRMFDTQIKLPSTSDGKPDCGYMEQYVKSLSYSDNL